MMKENNRYVDNFKVGDEFFGFKLVEKRFISEYNSEGLVFEHIKTKARVLYLKNDDRRKAFSIAFRTPPRNDTGEPHILEHSVLCGSKKFSIKDPFTYLIKSTIQTFLNAFTYPDKTVYPFETTNEKEYLKLMDIYLDAVFNPLLLEKEEIFLQEGWRFEFDEKKKLSYKGVVYGEMKGVFSDPKQILFRSIIHNLFPDNQYRYESGGIPKDIVKLKYDQLKEFHQKYYHPSNSYIYFYGDLDILEKLEMVDKEYLSKYDFKEIDSKILDQKPFEKPKEIEDYYFLPKEEEKEEKTYISKNYVLPPQEDINDLFGMKILDEVLFNMSASPLKRELFESDLGKNVYSSFDFEFKNPIYSIVVEGCDLEKKEKFLDILNKKLNEFVKKGFDKDLIISAVNKVEFELKEKEVEHSTLSIEIFLDVLTTWLYDDSKIFDRLEYNKIFENLKKEILEGNYLQDLIKRSFLENNHSLLLKLMPNSDIDPNLLEKKSLEEIQKNLTEKEINEIKIKQERAEKFASQINSKEDIGKIKLLDLNDIERGVDLDKIDKKELNVDGSKVNLFEIENKENGIVYNELFFNANISSQKELQYLELLTEILDEMRTKDLDFNEFSNEYNKYLGDINFNLNIYSNEKSSKVDDLIKVKLKVQYKYLIQNLDKVSKLINDFLFNIVFDKKRVKEILVKIKNNMKNSFVPNGYLYSIYDINSKVSKIGVLNNLIKGFEFYNFILDLEKKFDENFEEIISNLEDVYKKVFLFNLKEFDFWTFSKGKFDFEKFLSNLDLSSKTEIGFEREKFENFVENLELSDSRNSLFVIPAQINYVGLGENFKKFGFNYSGHLEVLKNYLYTDYLWENIRLREGAYGAIHNVKFNGLAYFVSYRDPNFEKTIDVYKKIPNVIKNLNFDEKEVRVLIIGAISKFDKPVDVENKLSYISNLYYSNIDKYYLEKIKSEILETNLEILHSLSPLFNKVIENGKISVFGFEELKSKKELDNIININ